MLEPNSAPARLMPGWSRIDCPVTGILATVGVKAGDVGIMVGIVVGTVVGSMVETTRVTAGVGTLVAENVLVGANEQLTNTNSINIGRSFLNNTVNPL
jgi:hypothetical protein